MIFIKKTILVVIWACLPGTLLGATIWSIPGGLWSTTSTSGPDCGCTPNASDDIIVDDMGASITGLGDLTGTIDILNGGELTMDGLTGKTPAVVTIRTGGSLIITGDFKPKETTQVIVEKGGTLSVGNRIELTQNALLVIRGIVNVGGDKMTVTNNASLIIESSGELNMTDPTSTLDINSVGGTLIVDGTIGTPQEFKLSGGTLGGSGTITHGGTCSGGGTINGFDSSGYCDAGLMNAIPLSALITTFYSFANGDWDNDNSWTLTSDGSSGAVGGGIWPGRYDNLIIRNGHTIDIDATGDNNFNGISPEGLYRANLATFVGSTDLMFYHAGDILISSGGSLTSTEEVMLEGYTLIENGGTFTIMEDIVNLGYLEISTTAIFNNEDDLILSGNSITIMDNTSSSFDDLYIDHTDATLCGAGSLVIGNDPGPATPTVQYVNGATSAQICGGFNITCNNDNLDCVGFAAPSGGFSIGITGPGGVATTDGNSELEVWLDASKDVYSDAGVTPAVDGGIVQQWNDQSGYGNNATKSAGNEPTFDAVQATINGAPAITFTSGSSNRFNLSTFSFDPASSSFSIISVLNSNSSTGINQDIVEQKGGTGFGRPLVRLVNGSTKIGSQLGGVNTLPTAAYTYNTWSVFSNTNNYGGVTTVVDLFKDGTADGNRTVTPESATGSWVIGSAKTEITKFFEGQMPEVIIMSQSLNDAKRIIIENYLSAKYNIPLAANDVYTMDDVGNGDYDFEVAGIGQAADGSNHRDAQGTGIVRMWNPDDLDNSEFLMWGHDNTSISSVTTAVGTDVDGTVIEERLSRIWRLSEFGGSNVGTVSISFDFSIVGSPLGSNLRLLIDRDNDFSTNDVTPIIGSVTGGIAVFSNVNFQDGDRFTLGNTDASWSLPIELVSFEAALFNGKVALSWQTASEQDNDFFTIERSDGLGEWQNLGTVAGAGNSNQELRYEFWDNTPILSSNYYRLKQTDFDGTTTYSSIRLVMISETELISVFPNPFEKSFLIYGNLDILNSEVSLSNALGAKVSIEVESQDHRLEINADHLKPGVYFLKVLMNNSVRNLRIIKQ